MFYNRPPKTYAELQIWKVFVKTHDTLLWSILHRWIKASGNPFDLPDSETSEERDERMVFQSLLLYITDP